MSAVRLILIELRGNIVPNYKVRAEHGLLEAFPEKPYDILLSNFEDHEQKLLILMVISYYINHPLSLVTIVGEDRHEISQCLHISESVGKIGEANRGLDEPKEGQEPT